MGYILNNENGIADKETFLAVVKAMKTIFIRDRINIHHAQKCRYISLANKKYQIENLEFLQYFPNVQHIEIISERLSSVGPLSQVEKVETIFIKNAQLRTLAPIAACKYLNRVTFINVSIEDNDFTPLRHLPALKTLTLQKCNVTNIDWIAGHPNLENLELDENAIEDFYPVKTLQSLKFICANWRVFPHPFDDLFS